MHKDDQPNGFHEAEDYTGDGEAVAGFDCCNLCWGTPCKCQEIFDSTPDPCSIDPRLSQNQRYQDIQKAADLVWRILDTHSIGDSGVGKAFSDIRDRVSGS